MQKQEIDKSSLLPWTRASEIWSLGAVVYCMMTGIPPPRTYDYNWQISRMTDKGFSLGLRQIMQDMLSTNPRERPITVRLVERVEEGWRDWRVDSQEGRECVDLDEQQINKKSRLLLA